MLQFIEMEKHYLVEEIEGEEYNIYCGTQKECDSELLQQKEKGNKNRMYVTNNRFD